LNLVKTALTYVAIFCVGAVTSVSCFSAEINNPSFRCNPSTAAANPDDTCPSDEVCCSDDPATTLGRLPNYFYPDKGKGDDPKYGIPIFSGQNNSLSSSGMCVQTGFDTPLVQTGCPVPCNPKWEQGRKNEICGTTASCCQVQELDPDKDCVMDKATGKWRAVTGTDIGPLTKWGGAHTTNQDPGGASCSLFASGGDSTKPPNKAILDDCYDQLSVADQRGFCYAVCPCFEDVCDMKNQGYVFKCGAAAAPVAM